MYVWMDGCMYVCNVCDVCNVCNVCMQYTDKSMQCNVMQCNVM